MFIRAMFLIVAGGDPPGRDLLAGLASQATMIIGADKGAQYCLEAGVTPHLVVGDLDSAPPDLPGKLADLGVEVKRFSTRKDFTDTHIALDEAISRGAKLIEIVGAFGDRFDHMLANVHLLRRALDVGVRARILSANQQIFLVDSEYTFKDRQGLTVSFLPLTEIVEGITLSGFAYELTGASMEIGNPYGVSNVILKPHAQVMVDKGILVVVLSNEG
jgi:thiamine pyrophosphokinase